MPHDVDAHIRQILDSVDSLNVAPASLTDTPDPMNTVTRSIGEAARSDPEVARCVGRILDFIRPPIGAAYLQKFRSMPQPNMQHPKVPLGPGRTLILAAMSARARSILAHPGFDAKWESLINDREHFCQLVDIQLRQVGPEFMGKLLLETQARINANTLPVVKLSSSLQRAVSSVYSGSPISISYKIHPAHLGPTARPEGEEIDLRVTPDDDPIGPDYDPYTTVEVEGEITGDAAWIALGVTLVVLGVVGWLI